MNIFILDTHPERAARALCDRHVVKMSVEYVQILSTVSHELGGVGPYRPTHRHHPCVVWAREQHQNYMWLLIHTLATHAEYEHRFRKWHRSSEALLNALAAENFRVPDVGTKGYRDVEILVDAPQCMPAELRDPHPVVAYRRYYRVEKQRIARWTRRTPPVWWSEWGALHDVAEIEGVPC